MTRVLFVGDPHVEPHSIQDAKNLMDMVLQKATEEKAFVVLAGDLYHTHGVIDANVQLFWLDFFTKLADQNGYAYVLKGNHDAPGEDGTRASPLRAHAYQACVEVVIDGPHELDGILFCPYAKASQLVEWSEKYSHCKTLFCHQTFDGSTYENGFYAGDGIDANLIRQEMIISGHIHSPQKFGKVWYPGAPRWRTAADANVERAVWILDFDDDGRLVDASGIETAPYCRKIHVLEDTPENEVLIKPNHKDDYRIVSRGPSVWLAGRAPLFAGWARWRGVSTDARSVQVRESEGVGKAFGKWFDSFKPKNGTPHEVLREMVKERLGSTAVVQ